MIVIVSGLPRSGTSLMMQMLQAGGMPLLVDDHRPADLNNPKGYFEYEPVKHLQQDRSWLHQAEGKAVKVISSLLSSLSPEQTYKILLMKRAIEEVVASQRVMLKRLGQQGSAVDDQTLGAMFERQLAQTECWLATQANIELLSVSYKALIQQPEAVAESIVQFVGCSLAIEEMVKVVDPHLYRQRA
jgi:hypothetical protein